MVKPRISVLASGKGSTLQNLIKCCEESKINAQIVCVISNKPKVGAIEIAKENKIPSFVTTNNNEIFQILDDFDVDLVVLAGYLALLNVPSKYENRILNIHPSLLPKFGGKGFYGLSVHKAVLEAGEKETGCTVHIVDDEYDNGKILFQKKVPIFSKDTPEILQKRVQAVEKEVYPTIIEEFLNGKNSN